MRRITVEEVKEAYAKTGMTPTRNNYGADSNCGCAIGALARLAGKHPVDFRWETFEPSYSLSFMDGFDDAPLCTKYRDTRTAEIGYQDGKDCAAAIFGEVKS